MSNDDMSGDIKKAREAGKSDEDILAGIKSYKPEYADDIDAAVKAGKSPKDVIEAVSSYKAPTNTVTQAAGMGMRALHDVAGVAKTIDAVAGTNLAPTADQMTQDPVGYQPADIHAGQILDGVHNDWQSVPRLGKNLLNYAKNVGQATVENSPTLAASLAGGGAGATVGSVAGPIGSVVGGALGAGAGYFALHGGRDAQRSANARAGDASGGDAPITTGDMLSSAANSAIEGNLSRLGVKIPFAKPLTAGAGLPGVAARVAEAGIKDAAVGAAGALSDQKLIEGKIDPAAIGDAALMAGTAGAATRATLGSIKDANAARISKNAGLDAPEVADAAKGVANELQWHGVDTKLAAEKALAKVEIKSQVETEAAVDRVKTELKPVKNADGSTTEMNPEIGLALKKVAMSVKKGVEPTEADIDTLRNSAVPGVTDLIKAVRHQDVVNRIKEHGGGLSDSDMVNKTEGIVRSIGVWDILHNPQNVIRDAGVLLGAKTLTKGIDAMTGGNNPIKLLADRHAGTVATPETAGLMRRLPQMASDEPARVLSQDNTGPGMPPLAPRPSSVVPMRIGRDAVAALADTGQNNSSVMAQDNLGVSPRAVQALQLARAGAGGQDNAALMQDNVSPVRPNLTIVQDRGLSQDNAATGPAPLQPPRGLDMAPARPVSPVDPTPATPVAPTPTAAPRAPEGILLQHQYGERMQPADKVQVNTDAIMAGIAQNHAARSAHWDSLQNAKDITPSDKAALASIKEDVMRAVSRDGVSTRLAGKAEVTKALKQAVRSGKLSKRGYVKAKKNIFKMGKSHGGTGKSFLGTW